MCKHVVLVPVKPNEAVIQKKTCQPAMFGRIWQTTRRAVALHHSPPHHFATCQWQTTPDVPLPYLVYRWLLFIILASIGVASFACQSLPRNYAGPLTEVNHLKWFIYFTNWGYMLIIAQSALALALVMRYRNSRDLSYANEDLPPSPRRLRTPLLCRAYWLVHNVATDLAFVITVVYWTLVHDPEVHEVNALNVLVHGGNSLVMLSELALTAHPVRCAHAIYGVCAGVAYGLFSAVYWAAGGTDRVGATAVYPPLDWNKPASAFGFVAVCAMVMVLAHLFATALATLRARLAARCARARPPAPHCERLTLPVY